MSSEYIRDLISSKQKYELLGELSEGASAYSFHARHILLDRPLFIKVYGADYRDEGSLSEPRTLVEALRNSPHNDNLVGLLDADVLDENHILLAMEFVEGGSVLGRLNGGPFCVRDSLDIAAGVLRGLSTLHSLRIVHRDIKPGNIMVTCRAGRACGLVTDFGSAKYLPENGPSVNASRHSALYVPPEGWLIPSEFDVRSDLYQVGMVLSELLHGSLPCEEEAYIDKVAAKELAGRSLSELHGFDRTTIVNRALSRMANCQGFLKHLKLLPYTSPVMKLVKKATDRNRAARFQTAAEMLVAIEGIQIPNWRQIEESSFEASNWCHWDWLCRPLMTQHGYQVQKARVSTGGFRKLNGIFATADDACDFVLKAKASPGVKRARRGQW